MLWKFSASEFSAMFNRLFKQRSYLADRPLVVISVAEWVMAWDSFLMAKESGRSRVRPPVVAL
jgi:hypothetical protein